MKFQLVNLISFLLLLNNQLVASANEEYYSKSILKELKEKKGHIVTDLELVDPNEKTVNHVEEKYSFLFNSGEYVGQEKSGDEKDAKSVERLTSRVVYLNETNEFYEISKGRKECETLSLKAMSNLLDNWAPSEVYNEERSGYPLGPNSLLIVLMENITRAACKPIGDDPRKQNCTLQTPNVRLEYHLESRGESTMYPYTIIVNQRVDKDQWKFIRQINYFRFDTSFPKVQMIDSNLPIGYGCKRYNRTLNFERIDTNYGDRFELEYEVVFRYRDENQTETNIGPQLFATKTQDEQPPAADKPKNYRTRIYFNRMYHDKENSMNVVDSVNEETNATTRTIYDLHSHINYDILDEEDKCRSFHWNRVQPINYFYIQNLFINHPEFFYMNHTFEYLGQYTIGDVPCMVFESTFSDYSLEPTNDGDTQNQLYLDLIRKNVNGVKSNYTTVTHYYPLPQEFWGKKAENLNVPMKIEFRLFSDAQRTDELAKLTINVASFNPYFEDNQIYDLTKCAEHAYDFNWFLVKFDKTPEAVQKYKKFESQIKNRFTQLLDISPLRLGEIIVDSDENSLYLTAKLLELAQVQFYFHSKAGQAIESSKNDRFADSEELCARRCFANRNCAAYAHCAALDCRMWIDENFDKEFDPEKPVGQEYDWSKVKTKEEKDCTLGTRFVKFDRRAHLSNSEFLEALERNITGSTLKDLNVIDKTESETFKASELQIDVEPGRHTKSSSKMNDERINDERNHEKYNNLFNITAPSSSFNLEKVKGDNNKDGRLIGLSSGSPLWECQLTCMNDEKCRSLSFCAETNECILTTLNSTKDIETYTSGNPKCSTSVKNFLAKYHMNSKRKLTKDAEQVIKLPELKLSTEGCAALCSDSDKCQSFDYCKGEEEGKPDEQTVACYLHNANPSNDKTDKGKPKWSSNAHCDHYTYKHSLEFNEYSAVKLKEADIGSFTEISLDNCASNCVESEICNSFDYCFDKDESTGNLKSLHCRLSKNVYSSNSVVSKQFNCSTYSRLKPRDVRINKETKWVNSNPVSGGLVTFLSILGLLIGCALGAGAAYYVIKNYFVSY